MYTSAISRLEVILTEIVIPVAQSGKLVYARQMTRHDGRLNFEQHEQRRIKRKPSF